MKLVPFKNEHAALVELQSAQRGIGYDPVPDSPYSVTAFKGDRVMFCGGMIWELNAWVLWALLAHDAGPHMIRIYRIAAGWVKQAGDQPVGMAVKSSQPSAHRLAKMLGMKLERHQPGLWPDGSDGDIYLRMPKCNG